MKKRFCFVLFSLIFCLIFVTSCNKSNDISASHKGNTEEYYYAILEANGGVLSNGENSIKCTVGKPALLPQATKSGYQFIGWYKTADFSGEALLYLNEKSDTMLYAKFDKIININYHCDGGISSNPTTMLESEVLTLENASKSGFVFDSWYLDEQKTKPVIKITKPNEDIDLYAKYFLGYYITYNLAGGNNNPANVQCFAAERGTYLLAPTRAGYEFTGWIDENGVSVNEIPAGTSKNVQLTATWQVKTYSITWNLNGGSSTFNYPTTYVYGSEIGFESFVTPTKDGMIFLGWYDVTENEEILTGSITRNRYGNIALKAKWYDNSPQKFNNQWSKSISTKDKNGNVEKNNSAYTINIPDELRHYAAQGRLGVTIKAKFTVKVRSSGDANGKGVVYLMLNGTESWVCEKSIKGGGYSYWNGFWTVPCEGSWGSSSGSVTKNGLFVDSQPITIGYRYYMSSDKSNEDVVTDLSYVCDSFEYSFYIT